MREQGYGKIINLSSSSFFQGVPGFIHYSTSKGGIIGFTRALGRELGEYGIRVNAIAPGFTPPTPSMGLTRDYPPVVRGEPGQGPHERNEIPDDLAGPGVLPRLGRQRLHDLPDDPWWTAGSDTTRRPAPHHSREGATAS